MNQFQTILSDIFDRGAECRLSQDEEREALYAAKAGDEAATVKIFYAYAAVLRNAVARFRVSVEFEVVWDGETIGVATREDELRSIAVLGLLNAVAAFDHDRHDRLAAIASEYVLHEMREAAAASSPVNIPARTRTRFFGILRRAGGNVEAAALLAPKFEMSRETFYAVLMAIRTERLDEPEVEGGPSPLGDRALSIWNPEDVYADAEDRILVEMAFGAVDDLETDICRASYGFTSYNPIPDGQIAADLSMTRPTVQRRRAGALTKMRDALGA